MKPIVKVCGNHELILIEDCCEALGATYGGEQLGTFGEAATFSFYYSHHITTGEGGMVVTKTSKVAELVRVLRAHGWIRDLDRGHNSWYRKLYPDIDPKFLFVGAGYNLRCTEMQAAMGLVQLPKLEGFVAARRAAAAGLTKAFSRYGEYLSIQKETGKSSWFGFPIIVRETASFSSARMRKYFEARGIETRSIICGNIARQPGMKDWPHVVCGTLEHADHVMHSGFSIGCHQAMGVDECAYVRDVLVSFMNTVPSDKLANMYAEDWVNRL